MTTLTRAAVHAAQSKLFMCRAICLLDGEDTDQLRLLVALLADVICRLEAISHPMIDVAPQASTQRVLKSD